VGIYLPVAEISVNLFVLLAIGGVVGFLSGLFGVGGGFLITPLLIFYNIPPAVAVATGANQVVASSFSSALSHFKRATIDVPLGLMLLAGGIVGSAIGVAIYSWLDRRGQLDVSISILFVVFLGTVGAMMLYESAGAIIRRKRGVAPTPLRAGHHNWILKLPFKMRFRRSKLYVSAIPVLGLGAAIGVLAGIMGVGGGFIMVPALIYLLRVPTNVVIGTSLFQITFVAIVTTLIQATTNHTVDIVLGLCLMVGGVIGAQYGVKAGRKLQGESLRALLALLILIVAARLALTLFVTPGDIFTVTGG
jgi:uncharacterized protein